MLIGQSLASTRMGTGAFTAALATPQKSFVATPPVRTDVTNKFVAQNVLDATPSRFLKFDAAAARGPVSSAIRNPGLTVAATAVSRMFVTNDLVSQARKAGLNDWEAKKLEEILKTSPDFAADASLMKEILGTPNADRALRSFFEIDSLRRERPDRITPSIVRALALGVAEPRTGTSLGQEGILGIESAYRAAKALISVNDSDYKRIKGALDQAGQASGLYGKMFASTQTERALLLESVAARYDQLSVNSFFMPGVAAGHAASEIVDFANTIRGRSKAELIRRSTVIDLDGDKKDEGLMSRWANGCVPTGLQIARAESDPIYAWRLHNGIIDTQDSTTDAIGKEQADILRAGDRTPLRWGALGEAQGLSVPDSANHFLRPATGRYYDEAKVENTPAARASALDQIEALLKQGTDVLIGAQLSGSKHVFVMTDVRGSGDSRQFLVTDPSSGRTGWQNTKDLIAGNSPFITDHGTLTHYFA